MPEISTIFAAFRQGEIRFEELDAALGKIVSGDPERAPEVQAALKSARDEGLAWNVYAVLRGNLDMIAERTRATGAQTGARPQTPAIGAPAEDETLVLGDDARDGDHTLMTGSGSDGAGASPDDQTMVNAESNLDGTTAPLRGSVADNAKRLTRDREATERTLMTYLGKDFVAGETGPRTESGDIFSQPFTEDEIANTELTFAPDPTQAPAGDGEFGPGHMLRQRFQLLKKLGEGGMGAVWRARDMLKVRARDRNPYVAIKLLTGDFREHPEAFIALQRETSKQQRLAHPNIATVFNFDRDQSTNTVFMIMEVMEGESLDKFIRKLPVEGLSIDEAMPIIEQLGAGLSYAHQNGLVHSDLKPGNCFLTRNGVVKLLDFGIARASKTEAHVDGERTLFDPGKLGAITPAYATVEMFDGLDPDPRDDIFALAIMAFQLLTGKHPFGRQNAPKAMSLGLEVPVVSKLSKRQNRGLARGLAFKREDRTKTVEEFLQNLRPPKSRTAAYVTGGIAAALVVAALANPVLDMVRARENASIIEQIEAGTPAKLQMGIARIRSIESPKQRRQVLQDQRTLKAMIAAVENAEGGSLDLVLALAGRLDRDWQQDFLGLPAVRRAILANFQARIDAAFDPVSDKLDYTQAWSEFQKLDALYPSSASVLTIRNALERKRDRLVADLENEYERLLELGAIVPVDADRDISDVRAQLKQLMPQHPLLSDERLEKNVAELALRFFQAGEFEAARRYLDAGLGYAPEDPTLENLEARLLTALGEAERERLGAAVRARLEAAAPSLDALEGFEPIKRDLVMLTVLDPEDPLAASLTASHRRLFERAYDSRIDGGDLDAASGLLASHAPMLDDAYLQAARARLDAAKAQAQGADPAGAPDLYASGLETLGHHVASATGEVAWFTDALIGIRSFTAVLPGEDPRLDRLRRDVVGFLLSQASEAASAERFGAGSSWIARARMVSPTDAEVDDAAAALQTAAVEARERHEQQRALAEFESSSGEFDAAVSERRPRDAEKILDRMRQIADAHADVGAGGVAVLGHAYAALGESYAAAADYESAMRIVSAAVDGGWASPQLSEARSRYGTALEQRALLIALQSRVEGSAPLDVAVMEGDLETLGRQFPDEITAIRSDLAARRSAGIVAYLSSGDADLRQLGARMSEFARLFPDSQASLKDRLAEAARARVAAESRRDPLAARRLADELKPLLPDDPALDRIVRGLAPAAILEARRLAEAGRLTRALLALENDRRAVAAHPEYAALKRSIALKQAQAEQKFKVFVSRVKTGALQSQEMRLAAFREVKSLWADNPEFDRVDYVNREPGACLADLAGEGREPGGGCYDPLPGGERGPLMVVVPPMEAGGRPFAIGKYEVSVTEFNRYCAATGACAPRTVSNDKVPVTGISLEQATGYADWLSAQAGAASGSPVVFRLPSRQEWRHAAGGGGEVPSRAINCRPPAGSALTAGLITSQGGTLSIGMPIGRSLVSATFGEANGWGVVNAVGNAQEWAITDAGVVATGGAFKDPVTGCGVDSERSHDGAADPVTGFRLVRELG